MTVGGRRRGAARGFTLVELSIASLVIGLVLITIVTVMSNIASARARSAWVDAAQDQLTTLMDRLVDRPYTELASFTTDAEIPDPCPGEPQVSCVPVRNTTARVEWAVVASDRTVPGGWAPAFVDVTARVSLAATGVPGDLVAPDVTRRVVAGDQVAGQTRATVTVVADGNAAAEPDELPSVYLIDPGGPSGPVAVSPAAAFDGDGIAHIALADASAVCTRGAPCRLAIGTDAEWWATDEVTLTAPAVAGQAGNLIIGAGERHEYALTFAHRGVIAVDLLARPDGGKARPGAEPNSICLFAEFSDGLGVQTVPECNAGAGREIRFSTYAVDDPSSTDPNDRIDLPIPADTDLTLLSDLRDGSCAQFNLASGYVPVTSDVDGDWVDAGRYCTSYTWGRPGYFAEAGQPEVAIADRWPEIADVTFGPPGTALRRYSLTWASTEARPATGYEGAEALFSDVIAANGPLFHLKLDEVQGEITLVDQVEGPVDPDTGEPDPDGRHPGTVSTIGGVALGFPGSMADDSTAASLSDDFSPALLVDLRNDVTGTEHDRFALRGAFASQFGLSVLIRDEGDELRDVDPQELLIYGNPQSDGWALRTNPVDRRLELVVNGVVMQSEHDAYVPGIWQQVMVTYSNGGPANVRFYVDGQLRGTDRRTVSLVNVRDELGVGRLCDCVIDEVFWLGGNGAGSGGTTNFDQFAASLQAAAETAAEVGGPIWSKPRVTPPCHASNTCGAERRPYVEYAGCPDRSDSLCLSANIAPIPFHEEFPFDHAFAPGNTTEWAISFLDPEGDSGEVRISGADLQGTASGLEYYDEVDEEWRPVAATTLVIAVDNAIPTTVRFRHSPNGYSGAILMPVRATDAANGLTRDYVLGFHGFPVAYGIDLTVIDDDHRWGQQPGNVIRAMVVGPSGQPLDGADVTLVLPGALGGTLTGTTGSQAGVPSGAFDFTIDTSATVHGTYAVRALVDDGAGGARQFPEPADVPDCVAVNAAIEAGTTDNPPDGCIRVDQTPADIVVSGGSIRQGGTDEDLVTVTVTDRAGQAYDGVRVRGRVEPRVGFDDNSLSFVSAGAGDSGAGTCTTGDNGPGRCVLGLAAAPTAKADPGYTVTVRSGNAVASTTVEVVGVVRTLSVEDVAIAQGESSDLVVTARTGDGAPAAGTSISAASALPVSPATAVTDPSGNATFTVTVPANADTGPETVTFTQSGGTPPPDPVNPVQAQATIDVTAEVSNLIYGSVTPFAVGQGSQAAVVGQATDASGDPVPNATVSVDFLGAGGADATLEIGVPRTVRTGPAGEFLIPIDVPAAAVTGDYELLVSSGPVTPVTFTVSITDPVPTVRVASRSMQTAEHDGTLIQGGAASAVVFTATDVDGTPVSPDSINLTGATTLDGDPVGVTAGAFTEVEEGVFTATLTNSGTPVRGVGHLLNLTVTHSGTTVDQVAAIGVTQSLGDITVEDVSVPQNSSSPATVRASDLLGDPFAGARVSAALVGAPAGVRIGATCPTSGPCSGASVVTGPDGTAQIAVAADAVPANVYGGAVSVTAETIDGSVGSDTRNLTVTPVLRGLSGPAGLTIQDGRAGSFAVSAIDQAGDPIDGVAIEIGRVLDASGRLIAVPEFARVSTGGCAEADAPCGDRVGVATVRMEVTEGILSTGGPTGTGDSPDDYDYQIEISAGSARTVVGLEISN
jgi:hypothetical protein